MDFSNGGKANEPGVLKNLAAIAGYCVALRMPDDWPGHQTEMDKSEENHREAISLNPNLLDPHVLDKIIKRDQDGALR